MMISSYGQSNPHSASLPHTFNVQSISGLLPKPTCGTGAASLSNQEQLSLEAPVPVNVPADRRISVVIRAPICVTLVAQTAEDACLAQQDKHRLQRRALEVIQNQHHLKVVRNTNDGSVQCVEAIPAAWLSPKSVTRLDHALPQFQPARDGQPALYCAMPLQYLPVPSSLPIAPLGAQPHGLDGHKAPNVHAHDSSQLKPAAMQASAGRLSPQTAPAATSPSKSDAGVLLLQPPEQVPRASIMSEDDMHRFLAVLMGRSSSNAHPCKAPDQLGIQEVMQLSSTSSASGNCGRLSDMAGSEPANSVSETHRSTPSGTCDDVHGRATFAQQLQSASDTSQPWRHIPMAKAQSMLPGKGLHLLRVEQHEALPLAPQDAGEQHIQVSTCHKRLRLSHDGSTPVSLTQFPYGPLHVARGAAGEGVQHAARRSLRASADGSRVLGHKAHFLAGTLSAGRNTSLLGSGSVQTAGTPSPTPPDVLPMRLATCIQGTTANIQAGSAYAGCGWQHTQTSDAAARPEFDTAMGVHARLPPLSMLANTTSAATQQSIGRTHLPMASGHGSSCQNTMLSSMDLPSPLKKHVAEVIQFRQELLQLPPLPLPVMLGQMSVLQLAELTQAFLNRLEELLQVLNRYTVHHPHELPGLILDGWAAHFAVHTALPTLPGDREQRSWTAASQAHMQHQHTQPAGTGAQRHMSSGLGRGGAAATADSLACLGSDAIRPVGGPSATSIIVAQQVALQRQRQHVEGQGQQQHEQAHAPGASSSQHAAGQGSGEMGGMGEAGPNGVAQGAFMVQGFPLDEHVRMILCEPKWKAYQAALRAPQVKGKVVLDVGAGTAVLAMIAAKAGAAKVYAVEYSPVVAQKARELVCTNGLQHRVVVLCGAMEDVLLPEPVDIIVSDWMGHLLWYEHIWPAVRYARDRWLKPGGLLMPCRAAVKLVGLGAAGPYTDLVAWAGSVDGQGQPAGGRHGLVFSPLVERSLSGVHPYSHLLPSWLATREVAVASWDLMQLTDDMDWEADFELPLYGKLRPIRAIAISFELDFPVVPTARCGGSTEASAAGRPAREPMPLARQTPPHAAPGPAAGSHSEAGADTSDTAPVHVDTCMVPGEAGLAGAMDVDVGSQVASRAQTPVHVTGHSVRVGRAGRGAGSGRPTPPPATGALSGPVLDTGALSKEGATHWGQCVVLLEEEVHVPMGGVLKGRVRSQVRRGGWQRMTFHIGDHVYVRTLQHGQF